MSGRNPHRHIVLSKLVPPPLPSNLVERERLLELLSADSRFRLVSAMPGYGKTVAVRQWIDRVDVPVAWLSLDLLDHEPMSFWTHVLAALRNAVPRSSEEPTLLLWERGAGDRLFLDALVGDLVDRGQPMVLVLDGLTEHVERSALEGVGTLVEHAGDTLHVVATTRSDPALPLAQWRGRGWLRELREHDLRLSDDEALAIAQRADTTVRDSTQTAALNARVDGWPIALHMALLSRPRVGDPTRVPFDLGAGTDRLLADSLIVEVLDAMGEEDRQVALELSVLEWFDPAMCEALVGRHAVETVARLAGRGMFLSVLDPRTGAMRFHGLFRELMEIELGWHNPAGRVDLHRRAATLWRTRGDLTSAYHHLAAIGESGEAQALLVDPALDLVDLGDLGALRRFAMQLPTTRNVTNAAMALDLAIVALYADGTMAARRWCERAETLLGERLAAAVGPEPDDLAQRVHGVRCVISLLEADLDGALNELELCRHPTSDRFGRRFPIVASRLMLAARRADEADRWIRSADQLAGPEIVRAVTTPTLRAWHEWLFGRLDRAVELIDPAIAWMDDHAIGAHHLAFDTLITGGWCRLSAGDLAAAGRLADRATADAETLRCPWNTLQAGYLTARWALVTGDPLRALRVVDDLRSVAAFETCRPYSDRVLAVEIEALAASGQLDDPAAAIATLEPGPRAKLLRARFEPLADVEVDDLLAGHRQWPVLERLQAQLVLGARHAGADASPELEALVLACADEGQVLPFLGLGHRIERLLWTLPLRQLHPTLAQALNDLARSTGDHVIDANRARLTSREQTLLELLPTHLSYAEMGERLYLSVNTVKSNLKTLYRKLDASTRAEAVERSRRNGLI